MTAESPFPSRILGRSGLSVGALGVAAGYGVSAAGVEYGFEHGMNYLYWGSMRTSAFAQALRNLKPRREEMVLVLQSYSRMASLVEWSVDRALRKAGFDYADVLLLGWWNRPVTERILEESLKLIEKGKLRTLAVSSHNRPQFEHFARVPHLDILHIRYNAAHRGAEEDVFPRLPSPRPGTVAYTATNWGQLMKSGKIPKGVAKPTAGDCYRYALSNPGVDVCMTGPSNDSHVRHAAEALQKGPMDAAELAWMRQVGDAVYGKRKATPATMNS